MVGVAVVATIVDLSLRFSVKGLPVGLMGFSQVLGKSNFFFFQCGHEPCPKLHKDIFFLHLLEVAMFLFENASTAFSSSSTSAFSSNIKPQPGG